jgi:hypothetical protein
MMWPIEKRIAESHTRAFVASNTVDALGKKMIEIIADRRMAKTHRYLGTKSGSVTLVTGLRVWYGGFEPGPRVLPGQSVYLHCVSNQSRLEGIGFHVHWDAEVTEEQLRERYNKPEEHDRRRDLTYVELTGWPGQPGRDDQIRIEHWNEHGVGQETIVAFDDVDPIQEIAWDLKVQDRVRQVHLDDEFCIAHNQHLEDPAHGRYRSSCVLRQATRAESLKMLVELAQHVSVADAQEN